MPRAVPQRNIRRGRIAALCLRERVDREHGALRILKDRETPAVRDRRGCFHDLAAERLGLPRGPLIDVGRSDDESQFGTASPARTTIRPPMAVRCPPASCRSSQRPQPASSVSRPSSRSRRLPSRRWSSARARPNCPFIPSLMSSLLWSHRGTDRGGRAQRIICSVSLSPCPQCLCGYVICRSRTVCSAGWRRPVRYHPCIVRTRIVTALLLAIAALASGQDPAGVAPALYKVEVDNAWVRVLRTTRGPHQKSPMHSHPATVVVCLTESHQRVTNANGTVSEESHKAGDVIYNEPVTHAEESLSIIPQPSSSAWPARRSPRKPSDARACGD